eukprot:453037-Pyramimonas_sp.AAC.1
MSGVSHGDLGEEVEQGCCCCASGRYESGPEHGSPSRLDTNCERVPFCEPPFFSEREHRWPLVGIVIPKCREDGL